MFKLVVLSAVLAIVAAAPKPGYLHGHVGHLGYSAVAAPVVAYSAPAVAAIPAVSHTRTTIVNTPVIAAAPVARTVYAAPAVGFGVGQLGYSGHLGYAGNLGYAGGHLGLGLARAGHLGYAGHYGHGHGW